MNLISLKPEKFQIYEFVYREIQQRKRAKHQNTYTGPHMIIKTIGSTSYVINSDKNHTGEIKVHYDHLKPFVIPSTEGWSVNMKYFKKPAFNSLGLNIFQGINVHIDFKNLSLLTLQLLNTNPKKIFIIPEWHCAPWYKPLHGFLRSKTNSVKLPKEAD